MNKYFISCLYIIALFCKFIQPEIVRYWGEKCYMDNDCTDHRLSCVFLPASGYKICDCDNFHVWDENLRSCKLRYNTTHLLTLLQEKHNTTGWIENEADLIFNGAMYAGLLVVLISIGCFLSILLYCQNVRKSDKKLKGKVKDLTDSTTKNLKKKISIQV